MTKFSDTLYIKRAQNFFVDLGCRKLVKAVVIGY